MKKTELPPYWQEFKGLLWPLDIANIASLTSTPIENYGFRSLDQMLVIACQRGLYDKVKRLLELGASVNSCPIGVDDVLVRDGDTPLISATQPMFYDQDKVHEVDVQRLKVIKLLVTSGAKLDSLDKNGDTALDHTISNGMEQCARYLLRKLAEENIQHIHASGHKFMCGAIRSGKITLIEELQHYGVQLMVSSTQEQTYLGLAIIHNNLEAAAWLLQYGVDVNQPNAQGLTPIQIALTAGCDVKMVQLLVQYGALLEQHHSAGNLLARVVECGGSDWPSKLQYLLCDLSLSCQNSELTQRAVSMLERMLTKSEARKSFEKKYGREVYTLIGGNAVIDEDLVVRFLLLELGLLLQGKESKLGHNSSQLATLIGAPDSTSFAEVLLMLFVSTAIEHRISKLYLSTILAKFIVFFDCQQVFPLDFFSIDIKNNFAACIAYGAQSLVQSLCKKLSQEKNAQYHIDFEISDITLTLSSCDMLDSYFVLQQSNDKKFILRNCVISDEVWPKFIAVLRASTYLEHVVSFEMLGCDLDSSQVRQLIPVIANMKRLESLNLSENYITYPVFRTLISEIAKAALTQLARIMLENNCITLFDYYGNTELLQNEIEHYFWPELTCIALRGNYCDINPSNRTHQAVLSIFLAVSQLTPQQLSECRWLDTQRNPVRVGNQYHYHVAHAGTEVTIQLSTQQQARVDALKTTLEFASYQRVFQYLQLGLQDAVLHHEVSTITPRQLQRFHPNTPLKHYLRRHPIFHTERVTHCASLLFPYRELTIETGMVYLVNHYKGVFGQHAMLAWEALSKSGQRIFKVAHLQDSEGIRIEYYTERNIDQLPSWLFRKCNIVSFRASRHQIKALTREVDRQIHQGVPGSFSRYFYASLQSFRSPEDKQMNCLRWAVECLNEHVGLDILPAVGHVPSETLKNLKQHPKRLDYTEPGHVLRQRERLLAVPLSEVELPGSGLDYSTLEV